MNPPGSTDNKSLEYTPKLKVKILSITSKKKRTMVPYNINNMLWKRNTDRLSSTSTY